VQKDFAVRLRVPNREIPRRGAGTAEVGAFDADTVSVTSGVGTFASSTQR
jgi:hypothetical protein